MEITIATVSLIISITTLWLTYLHRGKVRMTRPTIIYFGWDGKDEKDPKIFLRTLLFSTSQRGRIIESMHIKLHCGESVQTFNVWGYGERVELVRGSGLYVGREGVAYNHHFLPPKDGFIYDFLPGRYEVEVYASILNKKTIVKMFSVAVEVSEDQAAKMKTDRCGLRFDWSPESNRYHPYLLLREPTMMELYQKLSEQ